MTASDKKTDAIMDDLDALFAEAVADPTAKPSTDFMSRILGDAMTHQPMPQAVAAPIWQQFKMMIGGWQGMGGLVAATFAGLWIGINPPNGLPTQFDTFLNYETTASYLEDDSDGAELFGFGWDMEEG
jgi:hypothetical protein